MHRERSCLDELLSLKQEGKYGLISAFLFCLSKKLLRDYSGRISQDYVLEKIRDGRTHLYFHNPVNGKSNHFSIKLDFGGTGKSGSIDLLYNSGSWEELETILREEADSLKRIGFFIDYRGYIANEDIIN